MNDLKLFMINKGNLVSIKKPVFTTGDSYVVIDEMGKKVYIWLGSKCSTDEKTAAAVEAQKIDDEQYNDEMKVITYDEGQEGSEFLARLGGLKIIDKNKAKTMLKDVKTGEFAWQSDHVNALYQIKADNFEGMDAIKYKQVPFKQKSLDSDDTFIADLGVDIWVWQGKNSNVREKVKGMQLAREFDADRAGAQKPRVFMDGEDDQEFLDLFKGKLPKSDVNSVDLKPEVYNEQEKKKGLCAFFLGIVIIAALVV